MSAVVTVVGYDGSPLAAPAREALRSAAVVVGGRRHLGAVRDHLGTAEQVVVGADATSWADAVRHVAGASSAGQACVVLSSGDPGFFGVVRSLRHEGVDVRSWPATSSVSQAFARIGHSWEDATVVSAHGRPAASALAAARVLPKVAVLTGPAAPAELFVDALQRAGREVWVAERLGESDERVRHGGDCVPPYAEPNVVLALDGDEHLAWRSGYDPVPDGWGLPEDVFEHRDSMVTKAEVRALALARLAPRVGRTVWDLGSGSGSVAVECARFGADVIAVERDHDQVERLRRNALSQSVRVEVVEGAAPGVLADLRGPDAVFVGGGGAVVVEHVATVVRPRRAVVALAAIERVGPTLESLQRNGYAVDAVQLQASRLAVLPDGSHRLAAANPVTLVSGVRA